MKPDLTPAIAGLLKNDVNALAYIHALFCIIDSLPDKSKIDVEKVLHKIKTENFFDYPLKPRVIEIAQNHTSRFLGKAAPVHNPQPQTDPA